MAETKGASSRTGKMNVDTALVRQLAEMLAETGLTEIELAEKDRRIRVVRGVAQVPMQQVLVPQPQTVLTETTQSVIAPAVDPGAVLSPMVGAPTSAAPRLPASITPGPPPVTTTKSWKSSALEVSEAYWAKRRASS